MQTWTIAALVLCVALAVAWHLSYTAARLDRLHARVEGSLAALDAQLVRRADAALDWARESSLDPASAVLVATCAGACLQAADGARITDDVQEKGLSDERADAESALTACLGVVLAQQDERGWLVDTGGAGVGTVRREADVAADGVVEGFQRDVSSLGGDGVSDVDVYGEGEERRRLADACDRVELALRFHNEAVRDVRRVRAKNVVRWTHLAGHTALPHEVAFDAHVKGASRSSAWR